MRCASCGWKNPESVTFCRKCGTRLRIPQSSVFLSNASPSRLHRRRSKWRFLWIGFLLLILGGGGFVWWEMNASHVSASQTLQTYCSALTQGNYQQAYEQWASTASQGVSKASFLYIYQHEAKIMNCVVSSVSEGNSSASGTITCLYADGSRQIITLDLVIENGVWKILGQTSG
jgi:hypothetical protein